MSQTIEVELKFPVPSHEALRDQLVRLGARKLGTEEEEDFYFDASDSRLALNDEALRVRRRLSLDVCPDIFELTYKGAKLDTSTKTRKEITIRVISPIDDVQNLLSSLGFSLVCPVSKIRERWACGKFAVYLDDVKGLGTYVELEKVVSMELVEEIRKELWGLAQKLSLGSKSERRSYLELLLTKEAAGNTCPW